MVSLVLIGFVAGIVAGISPCILPVLPVVLVAGTGRIGSDQASRAERLRPVIVVAGLIISFSFVVLAGSEVLSLLGLPQDFLRDAGVVVLILVGLGLLIPPLGHLLERPFSRIGVHQPAGSGSAFVMGLAVGILFVPCAGPILSAIVIIGAEHRVGATALILTAAFAIGAAIPLLLVALAGRRIAQRVKALRRNARYLRVGGGVAMIVMAAGIFFSLFDGLQTHVPGYTTALQNRVEGSQTVRNKLGSLTGEAKKSNVNLSKCKATTSTLVDCGPAPNFAKISAWINTPGGAPLSISSLRGKVVLVDFWTYSCINCQRALPHVEAWYSRYAADGLVVVGVHTPEFPFEHVVSNVKSAVSNLGVRYPVAVDDDYGTWDAYDNEYWPADYLVDAQGNVRHIGFGEGDYSQTETLIRQLLTQASPGRPLPPRTAIDLGFEADDVYLVIGGSGTVQVLVNDKPAQTVKISGIPKLYTLFQAAKDTQGLLTLQFSPGIQAYDFTFG